jgi:hypothetical protein
VYRHAISSITPYLQEEQRQQPAVNRPAATKTPSRTTRTAHKPGPAQPQALAPTTGDQSLNNGMKEGLLKWMQEQKAAK